MPIPYRLSIIAFITAIFLSLPACNILDTKSGGDLITSTDAAKAGGYLLNLAMVKPRLEAFRAKWRDAGAMLESRQGDYGEDLAQLRESYEIIDEVVTEYSGSIADGGAKQVIVDAMKLKLSVDKARAAWQIARGIIQKQIEHGNIAAERVGDLMELDRSGAQLSQSLATLKDIPVGTDVSTYIDLTLQLAGRVAEVAEAY